MDLAMPRLSDTMEEGTLGRWLKQEGEPIEKGEVIAEIQTDKANMELEAFQGGVLQRILVQEGETVPIGQTIAVIGAVGSTYTPQEQETPTSEVEPEAVEAAPAPAQATRSVTSPASDNGSPAPTPVATGPGGRIKASPLARRIAQELGVDLAQVRGTGPHGRIDREDVEKAKASAPAGQAETTVAGGRPSTAPVATPQAPPPITSAPSAEEVAQPAATGEIRPLSRLERIIAERMVSSKTQVPHFYISTDVDMAQAIGLRQDLNALGGEKVSYNDLVLKAAALALQAHPVANATWTDEGVRINPDVNIGVAVAIERGLVVPVVKGVDRKPLRQVASEVKALAAKARENKLTPDELGGGTFTVSNLGMFGVHDFHAIVNQPQAAILAVGALVEQPVVQDGQVLVGNRMRLTLSADHRILYGAPAALFLQEIRRLLESPLNLGF